MTRVGNDLRLFARNSVSCDILVSTHRFARVFRIQNLMTQKNKVVLGRLFTISWFYQKFTKQRIILNTIYQFSLIWIVLGWKKGLVPNDRCVFLVALCSTSQIHRCMWGEGREGIHGLRATVREGYWDRNRKSKRKASIREEASSFSPSELDLQI